MGKEIKKDINNIGDNIHHVSAAENSQTLSLNDIEKLLKNQSKTIGRLIKERDKALTIQTRINEEFNSTNSYDKKIRMQEKVKESNDKLAEAEKALNEANQLYREIEIKKEELSKPEHENEVNRNQSAKNKGQKISFDELKQAKVEIKREVLQDDDPTNDDLFSDVDLSVDNEDSQESTKEETNESTEKTVDANSNKPPEESLYDDITDEELEKYLIEEQKAHEQAILDEEQALYEGMTEEEIKEAKERKIKFLELKKRYNNKEQIKVSDLGDYQKNLDFNIIKGLKKFRVKLPKSLYKIFVSILCGVLVISAVVSYIVLNRPPEPVVLTSLKLSQTTTYQTIGEKLDLRGVYLNCEYSDGKKEKIKVNENLISRTSNNIDTNYKITGTYNSKETAFVYFKLEEIEVKLDITLTTITVQSVNINLFVEKFISGEFISYDNILIIATMNDNSFMRINADQCSFKIAGNLLTKNNEGFFIPEGVTGSNNLTIEVYYNNRSFISLA